MSLAPYVQLLARGHGRARALSQVEAAQAMQIMLSGQAAPEAIGALLMVLRMRGETAPEIAGFAQAAQAALPPVPPVDLDWPCYAAGRTRGLPWFLLSARLVAMAGHRVLLHGWNGADAKIRDGLGAAGIGLHSDPEAITAALSGPGLVYVPFETLHPALLDLLRLREVFGLRSCVNTVCRMLNPGHAQASVQGVFHPSYRLLQADAASLLGWRALSVIKGGGGEFERHPGKAATCFGLRQGLAFETVLPAAITSSTRLSEGALPGTSLAGLWSNQTPDLFAQEVVISTAALALDTLGDTTPDATARQLWSNRANLLPSMTGA